jgi:hypothetical protein
MIKPTFCLKFCNLLYLAIIFISAPVSATLIDSGTFVTDTDTGLDWIDFDLTDGQSPNDVNARIAVGGDLDGWIRATGNEFDTLITNFGGTPMVCASGYDYCGDSAANDGIVAPFLSLFGSPGDNVNGFNYLFTADTAANGWYHYVSLNATIRPGIDLIHTNASSQNPDARLGQFGHILIRQSSVNPPQGVPTPSTMVLLAIGLASLRWCRRKKV